MKFFISCFLVLVFYSTAISQVSHQRDSLLTALQRAKSDSDRIMELAKLGDIYATSNPGEAAGFYEKAYRLSMPSAYHDLILKATLAANLSGLYQSAGDSVQEGRWLDTAISKAKQISDAATIVTVYAVAANHYSFAGQYQEAIVYSQRIIQLADTHKLPQQAGEAYITMGNMYFKMTQTGKAIEYYKKALLYTDSNKYPENDKDLDDQIIGSAQLGLSQVYFEIHYYDSAMYYVNAGIEKVKQLGQVDGQCSLFEIKAYILQKTAKYTESIEWANRALTIAKSNNITYQLPGAYAGLAIGYAHTGRKDSALIYARLANDMVEQLGGEKEDVVDMFSMWANVYEGLGDYKKAWEYKQQELDAYKKYRDNEVNKAINQNEIMFETKRKEQQIQSLDEITKKQRTIQWAIASGLVVAAMAAVGFWLSYRNKRKAAAILEQSNKEKEIFLKEIHHRVKNNLQIISSLLYLQFKDYKDEKMIAALQQAQQRIKSMALVHNKLYEKQDVVHVYLREYINDLAEGILASNNPAGKEINIQVNEKSNVAFSLDTSISIGLILNEVITNSCKYAFENKPGGNIQISLEQKEANHYRLHIADDGKGLPVDFEKKNSLGVRLIKNLARQMGGEASFTTGRGTEVTILFRENLAA